MYISNARVLAMPYLFIIYVFIFAGLLTYSVKTVVGMMQRMNLEAPAKNTSVAMGIPAKNTSPSVVELFTSEGCSSCPSADKLVALAQKEFNDNTIVLSYHVDYWDRLGWKDPYSKSAYSERQRQYAQHFKLESVYTPQVIVNGKTEFVGSNKSALWSALSKYSGLNNTGIETTAPSINSQQLSLSYTYPALQANESVVLELVLKKATTQVKRGENSGATLSHINIVQDIVQKKGSKGSAVFILPPNFAKENYMLIAFIQNTESFEINSAKKIAIL